MFSFLNQTDIKLVVVSIVLGSVYLATGDALFGKFLEWTIIGFLTALKVGPVTNVITGDIAATKQLVKDLNA